MWIEIENNGTILNKRVCHERGWTTCFPIMAYLRTNKLDEFRAIFK